MIEFENVSLTLGDFHLQQVSLTIKKGDFYFIIGPSGAGKTVLLEVIAGLHRPLGGRILLYGKDALCIPPEKRNLSLVYQDYSLFPHMTVYENIAFGIRMRKESAAYIHNRVTELMELFQITHLSDRHPLTMSGGEQQRVALARALAPKPDILLLDEPLSALDPVTRREIIADLRRIHAEQNLTIVQVTHARYEAIMLATRIAVIVDGVLISEEGTNRTFYEPETAELARFIGFENVLDGVVTSSHNQVTWVDVNGVQIEAVSSYLPGDRVFVCIRAENVSLSSFFQNNSSVKNQLPGTVLHVESVGSIAQVTIDCGFLLIASVLHETIVDMDIKPGINMYAGWKATSVHLVSGDGMHTGQIV